jgi:hypothetical protein
MPASPLRTPVSRSWSLLVTWPQRNMPFADPRHSAEPGIGGSDRVRDCRLDSWAACLSMAVSLATSPAPAKANGTVHCQSAFVHMERSRPEVLLIRQRGCAEAISSQPDPAARSRTEAASQAVELERASFFPSPEASGRRRSRLQLQATISAASDHDFTQLLGAGFVEFADVPIYRLRHNLIPSSLWRHSAW